MIKYELEINVLILKTDYFPLWFLYQSDLCISAAGKHVGIIIRKHISKKQQ